MAAQNLNTLSPLLARAGRNLALAKPILDLRDGQKKQQSKIHDAVRQLYRAKMKHESSTWDEWLSWKSLIVLYCRGEYFLEKNPRTPGYYVRPLANAANRQKAANLINTYRHMCLSKITSTNPNVRIAAADDDPRSIASAQNCRPVIDYWESQFYKARYNQRSGLHKLNAGISITRVRWNPLAQGPSAPRYEIEDGEDFQLGDGSGECHDCTHQGAASEFQNPELEYGAQCPECDSNAVDVLAPTKAPMSKVKQAGMENFGAPEISLIPLESCRWDLTKDFEESDWGIIRHRIKPGDLKILLGNAILPDSESSDHDLRMLYNLAYSGNTTQGAGRLHDKSPTAAEFWVSPSDLAELETEGGKTVDGEDLSPGRLDKVYGSKPVCFVGLNDMALIIGTYHEHTGREQIVTGQWQVEADSGAGRGIQDAAATQRRYSRWDGHIDQGLAGTATPAVFVDKRLLDDDQSGYIFKPATTIKLNLTQMPPDYDMRRGVHVGSPGSMNNQAIEYGQKHLMDMFQLQTFNLEFSDNLMNVDPRTLGGSQLASNLANSLYGPVGQIIGEERVAIAEKIYKLVKRYDPAGRYYPSKQGRGRVVSGGELEGNLVFELVQDSIVPTTPFTRRQDLGSFVTSMGGITEIANGLQTIPNVMRQFAKVANVQLEAEDADTVSTICLQRLEQMEGKLKAGVVDPKELVGSISPPPSAVEPKQKEKRDWWSAWLDLPDGLEAPLPLRQAAEEMYWLHENYESQKGAQLATNAGLVQGAGQAAAMAPAAMGQKALEGDQGGQLDPAAEAEAERALQEDKQQHEAATQAIDLQAKRDIEEMKIAAEDRRLEAELRMKDEHKEAELKSAERVVRINSQKAKQQLKPKAKAK